MDAEDRKKYWKDQIKAMLGPCMITFAIPLTIPGLTITLVAFSEDTTFQTYGALHIVGILCLAAAVILLILGFILRLAWKPIIGPDIEMHLSPLQSVASLRDNRTEETKGRIKNIYTGQTTDADQRTTRSTVREVYPRERTSLTEQERNAFRDGTKEDRSALQKERRRSSRERSRSRDSCRMENPNSKSGGSSTQDTNSTGSDSETAECISGQRRKSSGDIRSRRGSKHLNDKMSEDLYPKATIPLQNQNFPLNDPGLNEIQQWRKNKKSTKKARKALADTSIVNAASDYDDNSGAISKPLPKLQLNERPLPSNPDHDTSTGDENNSGQSARSPRQSLLQKEDSLEKKKRRKRKKSSKSLSRSESMETKNDFVLPHVLRARQLAPGDDQPFNDMPPLQRTGSSDSINSIGSADSVLAQYTFRNEAV